MNPDEQLEFVDDANDDGIANANADAPAGGGLNGDIILGADEEPVRRREPTPPLRRNPPRRGARRKPARPEGVHCKYTKSTGYS